MANVNIKAAASQLYPHHYTPITVMSMDMGELVLPRVIECEKGDKWSVKSSGRVRVAPTDFPCYGRAMMKSTALFVPGYQLLENYDSFRNNQSMYKGQAQLIPWVNSDFLNSLLSDPLYSTNKGSATSVTGLPAEDSYDFIRVTGTEAPFTLTCYQLNGYGRRVYKLFKSLGFDFHSVTNSNIQQGPNVGLFRVNMLPFVAFLKCYTDYFMNVHFYNQSSLVSLLNAIKHGSTYAFGQQTWYNADGMITLDCINSVLELIRVPHKSNMYLDSWNSQNSPLGTVNTGNINPDGPVSFVLNSDSQSFKERLYNRTDKSILAVSDSVIDSGQYGVLSQLGQNSLYALYEYVLRNNLFGTQDAKLAFARFGIKGDDYNSLFVRKLDENSFDIDFSAIMSNANTYNEETEQGSALGAYAGFGIGDVSFNFDYECSDYGFIICINWIQIFSMQIHGFDPMVMRRYPFDWYSPEFDGKASRAIALGEISYNKTPGGSFNQQQDDEIFGFTRLYEEYRHMRDNILGDFVLGKAKNFVFARDLSTVRRDSRTNLKPQTAVVQYYNPKGNNPDLSDPFTYAPENGDRFWVQILFDINASRPILSDTLALDLNGDGDLQMNTSGNQNS